MADSRSRAKRLQAYGDFTSPKKVNNFMEKRGSPTAVSSKSPKFHKSTSSERRSQDADSGKLTKPSSRRIVEKTRTSMKQIKMQKTGSGGSSMGIASSPLFLRHSTSKSPKNAEDRTSPDQTTVNAEENSRIQMVTSSSKGIRLPNSSKLGTGTKSRLNGYSDKFMRSTKRGEKSPKDAMSPSTKTRERPMSGSGSKKEQLSPRFSLEFGDRKESQQRSNEMLWKAAETGDTRTALALLEVYGSSRLLRAEVNSKGFDDCTSLHLATSSGSREMVEILLQKQAEIDCRTRSLQRTPLHLACIGGHVLIAKLLVHYGANI
eukprot:CAMPEP_0115036574 /NCGR_PEP_ID=MMETSP0216-20121206/42213_1 /TAXON_ID=223996 /ORGANISM="Protocruzia adherens, Strain Boccale" /LENGTH=318 /DNA_ID=CAMNT_0002416447 /DNA_START=48 /DNA_END=1001 /DNA_ORIENTATION=+